MTNRCEARPDDAVVPALNDLIGSTESMIAALDRGDYDELTMLAGVRQGQVEGLERRRTAPGGSARGGPDVQAAVVRLQERTEELKDRMRERSASIMSAIQALQKRRFYDAGTQRRE
ncbi:MAG: flagellar protein FliT [Bacteroidetes bacterium]|nr:MAG: flagellar protein FliT [Bacteroidota bacterium]